MISVWTVLRDRIRQLVTGRFPSEIRLSIFLCLFPFISGAQQITAGDSSATFPKPDSVILAPKQNIAAGKLGFVRPGRQTDSLKSKIKNVAKSALNQTGLAGKSLPSLRKKSIGATLQFENALMFHPVNAAGSLAGDRRYANILSLRTTINAGGIPLSFNFSTDRGSSMSQHSPVNGLFKFNLDPQRLKAMMSSDLMRYTEMRKMLFHGQDLTAYAREELKSQALTRNPVEGWTRDNVLSKYLDDPAVINRLLTMNKEQVRRELMTELVRVKGDAKSKVKKQASSLPTYSVSVLEADRIKANLDDLNAMEKNRDLSGYFNNQGHLAELRNLNEVQIAQKIQGLAAQPAQNVSLQGVPDAGNLVPVPGFDLARIISNNLAMQAAEHDTLRLRLAHQIFISVRQNNAAGFDKVIGNEKQALESKLQPAKTGDFSAALDKDKLPGTDFKLNQVSVPPQVDSVAAEIDAIRSRLGARGLDVRTMLQQEEWLKQRDARLPLTEALSGFENARPGNGLQSLFNNVDALKLGSFGNQVPGGVQSTDLFMSGTHLTYKLDGIPLTAGYGAVNDIGSFKDAAYTSSIYNQPRNMTYLAAELPRARGGKLKISVISAYGKEIRNSAYALPGISNNNVAVTLSKDMRLGKFGNMSLDLSKTATLYNNNYQVNNEALLDRKAGLTNTLTNDLFSAMSFGARHDLELDKFGASDSFYFNYAGMGYQNPANNGFGGARMKYGGNIRKSFLDKRLSFGLRADLNNMPISYTSSDKWKTYQFQFDTRYQVNKQFSMNFKYANGGTDKMVNNIITPVYGLQKLQVDGNIRFKLCKQYTVSHLTVGTQNFSNVTGTQGAGNLLMLNYTQTTVFRVNSLTTAIFYNKELSSYQLIGNMLTADMTYNYRLFEKLNFSSGLTYLNNTGIVRQVGFRQGVQLLTAGHFDLDSYVDFRRNLLRSLYPDLYPSCRAELTLKYHISI